MSRPDLDRVRFGMQVRWDVARERRVLRETLHLFAQRTRRRRAVSWAIAATIVVVLLFRLLPSLDARGSDSGGFAGAGATSGGQPRSSGTGGTAGTG